MPHTNAKDAPREHAEAIEDAMQGAPPAAVRNINYDVHSGHAAQRPWAQLEDHLAQAGGGKGGFRWPSFDALQASLPEGDANEIEQDEFGDWCRFVPYTIDHERDAHGDLYAVKEDRKRYVALSKDDARARSAGAIHVDFFDGFTWWRDGLKPERDVFVEEQQDRRRNLRRERVQEGYGAVDANRRPLRRERLDPAPRASEPELDSSPDYSPHAPADAPVGEANPPADNPVAPPAPPPAPPAGRPRRPEGN